MATLVHGAVAASKRIPVLVLFKIYDAVCSFWMAFNTRCGIAATHTRPTAGTTGLPEPATKA